MTFRGLTMMLMTIRFSTVVSNGLDQKKKPSQTSTIGLFHKEDVNGRHKRSNITNLEKI